MTYCVYIIFSETLNRYYVGQTSRLSERLKEHNSGYTKFTKAGRPWVLVHTETFFSCNDAVAREKQIKQMKSSIYIKNLIKSS